MDTFNAYRLTDVGGAIQAGFVECTLDTLDPGDVLVRVAYSGVNYKDALAATGTGRILRRASCIGGIDFAGTVAASTDSRFSVGEEVVGVGFDLGVAHDGGYAEYVRVPGDWVVKLPAGLSLWEAMALGTAGFTAALAIIRMERNGLTPGHGPVVVSGATGGVGSIVIAALARLGYHVVALTGKSDVEGYLNTLGAAEVMPRSSLDLTRLKPLGRATWAGGVDNLGGSVLAWMSGTMKVNGVIASIGLAESPVLNTTVMPFILRGVSLLGISSTDSPDASLRQHAWRRLATDMKPPMLDTIARTIAFAELPSVFAAFMTGQVRGRIVVRIDARAGT